MLTMPLTIPVANGTAAISMALYTDMPKPSQRKPFFASIWSRQSASMASIMYPAGAEPRHFKAIPIAASTVSS